MLYMFRKLRFTAFFGKKLCRAHYLDRFLSVETNALFQWNSKITRCFKKRDVKSARKLFDEMSHKNVVTWNCMISGYIKNGMIREARELFVSMPNKNVVSWTAMLSGYAKNWRVEEARGLFDLVEDKNVACWNSMISGYVNCGMIEEGRSLFDAMPAKNDVSWAMMIEGYFRYGVVEEAESLFNETSNKSLLICNAMLAGYGETGDTHRCFAFFMRMSKRDVVSWTCVIKCFMRAMEVDRARELFEEMPDKDTIAWTVMIKGYLDNRNIESAQELFDKMPHKDIVAWNSMLTGYVWNGKLGNALDLYMRIPARNVVSSNLMIWGYIHEGDITTARKFFEGLPDKNATSWNTLISGYQNEEALSLYVEMLSNGFNPDQGTLTVVIPVCGILVVLGCGRVVHGFVVKTGYENDMMVMSSLISMYSRCGFISDACLVFETMQSRDTASWNAMIVAQAHHGSAKVAFDLFDGMIRAGYHPDRVTFLVLLSACAHSGLVTQALEYFKLMQRWNVTPCPEHLGSMVHLFGKSGLLKEASKLVNQLPVDLPVYARQSLLSACRIHENYESSDIIAKETMDRQSCDVGMCVLQSNIYAARGMWKDAANIREKVKQSRLTKEPGSSWIDINGVVPCS